MIESCFARPPQAFLQERVPLPTSFINLPIVDALSQKYPAGYCAYCSKGPCECHRNRKTNVVLATTSDKQHQWTVNDWVKNLDAVYGGVNRARGIDFIQLRLIQEYLEATNVVTVEAFDRRLSLNDVRYRIAKEFADMFAWQFTLAAVLDINLGSALSERYSTVHKRCGKRPCMCGNFTNYCFEDEEIATGTIARPS